MSLGRSPDPAFWRGRRVLVTGNTGFKGSWLCVLLEELGAAVSGLALPPHTEPNLWTLARLADRIPSRLVDVRDRAAVGAAVAAARPQTILHLAAQTIVKTGYAQPVETYASNVLGTVHVLDAARCCEGVEQIVVVTSDKVYADAPVAGGYTEDARLGGADPYSGSKACAELVAETFREAYFSGGRGPALATARAGNVIGGGDYAADRLLPDFVRALTANETLVLRRPEAIRPWQHVLDPLAGYVLLAEALAGDPAAFAGAWNFGPAEPGLRVDAIVELFARAWGPPAESRYRLVAGGVHETERLEVDAARARAVLGWDSRWNAAAAVERSAHWYRDLRDGVPAAQLVERDLAAYRDAVRS